MKSVDRLKQRAAVRAVDYIQNDMLLGLGTGTTAAFVLEEIALRLRDGRLRGVAGVPTSEQTRRRADRLGIATTTLEEHPALDLLIDGADEVDPDLNLIKGAHGALLREKLVASCAAFRIYVVDESKRVSRLGERVRVPVEVVPFGWTTQMPYLESLEGAPSLRLRKTGRPFVTDGGHYILDCAFGRIDDPPALQRRLRSRPGIVESGLFVGIADLALIGTPEGVLERRRTGGMTR